VNTLGRKEGLLYHQLLRGLAIDRTRCLYEHHRVRLAARRRLFSVLCHHSYRHSTGSIPQPSLPNTRTIFSTTSPFPHLPYHCNTTTTTTTTTTYSATSSIASRSTPTHPLRTTRSSITPSPSCSLPFANRPPFTSQRHLHPRVRAGQRPHRRHKVAQVLDFGGEALESEYPEMAVGLARGRRVSVSLCLTVERTIAPAFSWPFALSSSLPPAVSTCFIIFLLFLCLWFSLFALFFLGAPVNLIILSVESGRHFFLIGEFKTRTFVRAA
jgi:hypothetical protein